MLKEALDFLVNTGKHSSGIQELRLPGARKMVVVDGQKEVFELDPQPIEDAVASLSDLVAWGEVRKSENKDPFDCEIFVARKSLSCYVNRKTRVGLAVGRMEYKESAAGIALATWIEGVKQPALVRLLRGPLAGTYDEKHLAVFRRLNFTRLSESARDVRAAGEKLGRSVESAAQSSAGDLPEVIAFSFQLYAFPECPVITVRFALEVDAEAEILRLIPVGDQLEEAKRSTQMDIAAFLRDRVDYPVYCGVAG